MRSIILQVNNRQPMLVYFLVGVATLFAIVYIGYKFFWLPFKTEINEQRERTIKELEQATADKHEARKERQEAEKILEEAKQKAEQIIMQAKQQSLQLQDSLLEETKAELVAMQEIAQQEQSAKPQTIKLVGEEKAKSQLTSNQMENFNQETQLSAFQTDFKSFRG